MCIPALILQRPLASASRLSSFLFQHYRRHLRRQLFSRLGFVDLFVPHTTSSVPASTSGLGGSVEEIEAGVYSPAEALVRNPSELRAEDITKELGGLVSRAIGDGLSTTGWISREISRNIVQLAPDTSTSVTTDSLGSSKVCTDWEATGSSFSAGIANSDAKGGGFFETVGKSLFSGVGSSVLRPSAGFFELAARATDQLSAVAAQSTTSASAGVSLVEFGGRVRAPRGRSVDGILRIYDAEAAKGVDALQRVCSGKFSTEALLGYVDDAFLTFCCV